MNVPLGLFILRWRKFAFRIFMPLIRQPRWTALVILLHYLTAHKLVHHLFVVLLQWRFIKRRFLPWWLTCKNILLIIFMIVFFEVFQVWGSWWGLGMVFLWLGKFLIKRWVLRLVENVAIDDQAIFSWNRDWRFVKMLVEGGFGLGFFIEVRHRRSYKVVVKYN